MIKIFIVFIVFRRANKVVGMSPQKPVWIKYSNTDNYESSITMGVKWKNINFCGNKSPIHSDVYQ